MEAGTFTLKPLGGLCNRLFAINSAINLCESAGMDLEVIWIENKWLNAAFSDLFQGISNDHIEIQVRNYTSEPLLYTDKTLPALKQKVYNGLLKVYQRGFFDLVTHGYECAAMKKNSVDFLELIRPYKRVYFSSWDKLDHAPLSAQRFRPIESVMARINGLVAGFGSDTIGVHIRRGDHHIAIRDSGLELFLAEMEVRLQKNMNTRFFVASDSAEVKDTISKTFGENVLTANYQDGDRDSKSGMLEAVVDLFTLAATKELMGNSWSTFSIAASEIGSIPFTNISASAQ